MRYLDIVLRFSWHNIDSTYDPESVTIVTSILRENVMWWVCLGDYDSDCK